MRILNSISNRGYAEKPLSATIRDIRLDFDVFDLLKITVFQAMMVIASRQSFQKNTGFVYSSVF